MQVKYPRVFHKPYFLRGGKEPWTCQIWLNGSVTCLGCRDEEPFWDTAFLHFLSNVLGREVAVLWRGQRSKPVIQFKVEPGFEEPAVWNRAELWLGAFLTSSPVSAERWPSLMPLPILPLVLALERRCYYDSILPNTSCFLWVDQVPMD